jgi:hypothetical protein
LQYAKKWLQLVDDDLYSAIQILPTQVFDILSISKPQNIPESVNLSKIISKLSPLVGNLIEFRMVEFLNEIQELKNIGVWKRQDPGFPDTIFDSKIRPAPGFEIKAWFPLATEITARFKDSQNYFYNDQTYVLLIAWLPEYLLFGRPQIIDICSISGKSIAEARDTHYHNPPDYLALEPEDTTDRTSNLQQTNTNGYKFQGDQDSFYQAKKHIDSINEFSHVYEPTPEYQTKMRKLFEKFRYRLDTNYAKIDRIVHPEIESFKTKVLNTILHGITIGNWAKFFSSGNENILAKYFKTYLSIE